MKTIIIKNRWTDEVLFKCEVADDDPCPMRTAVAKATVGGADLSGANLSGANLDPIRDDFRARLDCVPHEVAGLLAAVRDGKIDGSAYSGDCACFVGTVAKIQGCSPYKVPNLLADSSSPTERFFMGIAPGHTPDNNPVLAIVDSWICEWQAARGEGELLR